jgi:hypothetical protein
MKNIDKRISNKTHLGHPVMPDAIGRSIGI